jgi:membrane associated rhomboid family serine protease
MFLPYRVDVAVMRRPYANWALIGVTCIISLVWLESPVRGLLLSVENLQLYQFVSHAFIHASYGHLFGNMLFLFLFGNAVNAKLGHAPYLGLYLVLACVSGLAWYFLPGDGLFALGASGAVMGIAGVFFMYYPFNEVSILYWFYWRFGTFELAAFWLLILYIALDLIGVIGRFSGVAHISHVAGFATGAAVSAVLIVKGIVRPEHDEQSLLETFGMTVPRAETVPTAGSFEELLSRPTPLIRTPPPPPPPLRRTGTFPSSSTDSSRPPRPPAP